MSSLIEKTTPLRRSVARLLILSMLLAVSPIWAMNDDGATLEGMLLDESGRPATGLEVVLFDGDGEAVAETAVNEEGIYGFSDLPAGTYALGVRDAAGTSEPVAAAAVEVGKGELVRRDLQKVSADSEAGRNASINYGLGTAWAGLSRTNQVWVVVGVLAGAALIYTIVEDDDDDDETTASPAAP